MSRNVLAISKELEATGFTKFQADTITAKMFEIAEHGSSVLVTKGYLKTEIAELEIRIIRLESRLLHWMIGLQLTTIVLLTGLVFFLSKITAR